MMAVRRTKTGTKDIAQQFTRIQGIRKGSQADAEYLRRRKVFAEQLGMPTLFDYVDQFGIYAGAQTIASRILAYEVVRQSVSVPGHILEFGVWHGSNLLFMAKVLRLLQPNTTKQLFGFDNFSGLPVPHAADGAQAKAQAGRYRGNEEVLRAAIELYDLQDWVHLVVGDALKTIPAFEAAFPEAMVSLAWVDFDLFEPTRAALSFLSKRLACGGIIVLDEAISHMWPGETVALLKFLETSNAKFSMRANTLGRQPVMYLVREQ